MSRKFVSSSECDIILRTYLGSNHYELLDYSIQNFSDVVEGFLGEHFWLTIQYKIKNNALSKTFFMKTEPEQYELQHEFATQCNAFNNELFLYKKIIPEFKKYYKQFDDSIAPKYYYSRDKNIVVLENLAEYGYKISEEKDVLTYNHLKAVLNSFAKLHAASIIYEEKKSQELGRQYKLTDEYEEYLKETFFQKDTNYLGCQWVKTSEKCILAIIDAMPELEDISKEKFKQNFSKIVESGFDVSQPSTKFRNVLCHADLWRKNILFRYENNVPVHCKLIDFQLMKYYPPIYDVMKFIYQCTSSEMRQHHMDELIEYYYSELCKELKLGDLCPEEVLPFSEITSCARYIRPYILVEASFYYTFQKVDELYFKEIMLDREEYKKFVFKDRVDLKRRFYKPNTHFQHWMDEIILEIKDVIIHDGFSRDDCRSLLKSKLKTTNYDLTKYYIMYMDDQNGFLGTHKKINVLIKQNGKQRELNFFAKFLPLSEFSTFAIEAKAFDNEEFIYAQLFEKMSEIGINIYDCVPKYYFSRKNDVIIFEDLNEYGFTQINKYEPIEFDAMKVIIKTLAKYHASSFIFEEKMTEKTGKTFRISDCYEKDLQEVTYNKREGHIGLKVVQALIKGVKTHIDLFPDDKSTITDDKFKMMITKIYGELMTELCAPSTKYRNVICHGDLWANNILLKHENNKPICAKFVDFQLIKQTPPAQDLMCLLHFTTTKKFREYYKTEIFDIYHKELTKNLQDCGYDVNIILPYKEFLESCEYYKLFAIPQTVGYFHFIMATAEDMGKLFKDDTLCHKTFYEDRSEYIVKMCEVNSRYKLLLKESLEELRNLCETIDL